MASIKKTIHLGLNQWVGSDKPERTDVNNDNWLVDEALAELSGQLNGWTIFNSIAELGLTVGQERIRELCEVMPDRSVLYHYKTPAASDAEYPAANGLLKVERLNSNQVKLYFGNQEGEWFGFYSSNASPVFQGWKSTGSTFESHSDVEEAIHAHNNSPAAHTDIRETIDKKADSSALRDGLNTTMTELEEKLKVHTGNAENPHGVNSSQITTTGGKILQDNLNDLQGRVQALESDENVTPAIATHNDDPAAHSDIRQLIEDIVMEGGGDADQAVTLHNTSDEAHTDIRTTLSGKANCIVATDDLENGVSPLADGTLYVANEAERVYIGINGVARLFYPPVLAPEPPTSPYPDRLEEWTWQEINEVALQGQAEEYFSIGDERIETIGGLEYTLQIVGFNHDDLADGSGKANITFSMKHLYDNGIQMNTSNTNKGGFEGSFMHSFLNGAVFDNCSSALRRAVKSVTKLTSSGSMSTVIKQTSMKLFLFSEWEIYGDSSQFSASGEGIQYPIFTNFANRIKRLSNGEKEAFQWWTRSPYTGNSSGYVIVNADGSGGYSNPTPYGGMCIGFCI